MTEHLTNEQVIERFLEEPEFLMKLCRENKLTGMGLTEESLLLPENKRLARFVNTDLSQDESVMFINIAKNILGVETDSELGARLKIGDKAVNQWRHGRARPKDSTMCRLCELIGYPPAWGLGYLGRWKNGQNSPAYSGYTDIITSIKKTAAAAALLPLVIIGTAPVSEASVVNPSSTMAQVNIMGNYGYGF